MAILYLMLEGEPIMPYGSLPGHTMAMVKSGNINGTHCENVTGPLVPLEQFDYSNEKMGCLIHWNIQQRNFSGVSVRKYNLSIT